MMTRVKHAGAVATASAERDEPERLVLLSNRLHAIAIGVIAAGLVVLGSSAVAQAAENSGTAFLKEVAQLDMAEVAAGQLAEQQAANAAVKDFGRMLVTDHSQHKTEVESLAKAEGVTLPAEPKAEDQQAATKLKALSGAAFDRAFITHMVDGHKQAIAKFEQQAKSGNEVGSMAKNTLPTLQKHLAAAQALMIVVGEQTAQ
jgi:putative membrane protein